MKLNEKLILVDFEKYLERKKHKIGNATHGFERGQRELIIQIWRNLNELKKRYEVK